MNINYVKGLAAINSKRGELATEAIAIMGAADSEGRDLTAEEGSRLDAMTAQTEALKARAARTAQLIEIERGIAPMQGPPGNIPGQGGAPDGFSSLGEQLQAVYRATISNGQNIDPRLLNISAAAGANIAVPSEGGWLVQQDFSGELIQNMFDSGQVASRVRRMPIGAGFNGVKLNGYEDADRSAGTTFGGIISYWADESVTVTASKPKFRQISLKLNKLMGVGYATDELLQDAVALSGVMTAGFTQAITFKSEDSFVNGNGAGQPMGILASAGTISVAKEAGQAADTIVWENIKKMYSRMKASSVGNAVWFINQECMLQLMGMYQTVGLGGVPVWLPPNGAVGSPFSTLMGRPVIPAEYFAGLGDTGDIVFADLSQYLVIDKGAPQQTNSMHVRFLTDEMTFRVVYRLDGQPLHDKPITPYKGTTTTSSFVKLDAR